MNSQDLATIVRRWKDEIKCFPPYGTGYEAYINDSDTGNKIKYIDANCDSLRHNATNYEVLLKQIKAKYKGVEKEAILNTIKYETTRRAFKQQHEWIHIVYKEIVLDIKTEDLNKDIQERTSELEKLKAKCKTELQELQQKYKKLQTEYNKEKKRRQQLGINNKSLGAYKGLFTKAQKKIELLKQENKALKKEIATLKKNS